MNICYYGRNTGGPKLIWTLLQAIAVDFFFAGY